MKELLIYRHAKTEKPTAGMADFDRGLLPRGIRQAAEMAEKLREKDLRPDLVITSPALRARQTTRVTLETLASPLTPLEEPELYATDAGDYIAVIARSGDDASRLVVVGHNPACEELVELLTGTRAHLRTAALARVRLPIDDWTELSGETKATLVDHLEAEAT